MGKNKDEKKKSTDDREAVDTISPEPSREEPKPVTTSSSKKNMGTLINGLLHPVTVQYGEHELQLHPKQRMKKVNGNMLGKLPNKVVFIPSK